MVAATSAGVCRLPATTGSVRLIAEVESEADAATFSVEVISQLVPRKGGRTCGNAIGEFF
jgi:hypothetical protein